MSVCIKRGLTLETVAAYLEEHGVPAPEAKPIPALYLDACENIASGAYVDGKLAGVLLGRRINRTIWVHLVHSLDDAVEVSLRRDLNYYAKQFAVNVEGL